MPMNKWQNFYQKGLAKENEFAELLITNEGGTTRHASRKDDIYGHIDIIWTINNHDYFFDVKSLKKTNRTDNKVNDNVHWIELQNVLGNIGWLYGKAHYIAFETLQDWLVVRRVDIISMLELKVINNTISKSKDFYTYYQRDDRQDIIVKVPTDDLRKIARKVFKKNTLI